MAAKFSPAEVEAVDLARGDVSRSEWLRTVALAAAGKPAATREEMDTFLRARYPVPDGKPAARVPAGKPGSPPGRVPFRSPEPCPHPKARVHRGFCGCCGTGGLP